MRLILETSNTKEFIEYTGAAIEALFLKTKGNVQTPVPDSQGLMIVSYTDKDKVINLHLSSAFNYGIYEAVELANALNFGIAIDTSFQIEKITSHSKPAIEAGLSGIKGENICY